MLIFSFVATINRFSVGEINNNNGMYGNDKKPPIAHPMLKQCSLNAINKLLEKLPNNERQ